MGTSVAHALQPLMTWSSIPAIQLSHSRRPLSRLLDSCSIATSSRQISFHVKRLKKEIYPTEHHLQEQERGGHVNQAGRKAAPRNKLRMSRGGDKTREGTHKIVSNTTIDTAMHTKSSAEDLNNNNNNAELGITASEAAQATPRAVVRIEC